MNESRGLLLVFCTALVSGVSIFLNSFAVSGFNPFAFTFLKNALVAVFLLSLILLLKESSSLKSLSRSQWLSLASIGLIGGSIPFLLFFYALKLSTPATAGFVHKTLFIWASVLAIVFLREKISKGFLAGALLLLAGNFIFFGPVSFGFPELLVLGATVLWAAENVLSKHVLKNTQARLVMFGRMFFGSAFILAFLVFTNQLQFAFSLSFPQIQWLLLTSSLLFLFVFTYYSGLKYIPVHKAASILLLAQPITAVLSFAFLGKQIAFNQAIGLSLIVTGAVLVVGVSIVFSTVKRRAVSLAGIKF
ncbi:MAG: DMT family transporter [archaeon]|nr:DMT family transporter [archaeon]